MDLIGKIRDLGDVYGIDYIGVAGIAQYHKEIAEIGGGHTGRLPAGARHRDRPAARHSGQARHRGSI